MNFMPHGSEPHRSQFTCNTCGIKFITAELQRKHMKTDWHRYNLKRRVASLPSISSDVFAEKVLQSHEEQEVDDFGFPVASHEKKVFSLKTLQPPLKRKLLENSINTELSEFSIRDDISYNSEIETGSERNFSESDEFSEIHSTTDEESEDELIDEEETKINHQNDLSITDCFFCDHSSGEIELNIKHMFNKHGLYIPERSFLIDVEGILDYIMDKIENYECLVCSFTGKNLLSIRQHIRSKGHCKIPYETKEDKLEISKFYEFYEEEFKPKTKSKVTFNEVEDQDDEDDEDYDEDECEEDSDDDNGINDNYSVVQVNNRNELTLPTGSIIAHRSTRSRQNPLPLREFTDGPKTTALVDRRFAPGLTSHIITKHEKEAQKAEQKAQSDSVRRDKMKKVNYQPHFRDFVLGT